MEASASALPKTNCSSAVATATLLACWFMSPAATLAPMLPLLSSEFSMVALFSVPWLVTVALPMYWSRPA
ncbi:hypothetical protein D3C86_1650580 [compost metagenome]